MVALAACLPLHRFPLADTATAHQAVHDGAVRKVAAPGAASGLRPKPLKPSITHGRLSQIRRFGLLAERTSRVVVRSGN
jgi:hypothetical protein